MEEAMPLTMNERAAVAVFAVRLQTKQIMPHCDKINLCCNIVEPNPCRRNAKEIYQTLPNVKHADDLQGHLTRTPCWPAACV
jgi:hypothetical protein